MKGETREGQDQNRGQRGRKRKKGSTGLGQRPNTLAVTVKSVAALYHSQNSSEVPKISTPNLHFAAFRDIC